MAEGLSRRPAGDTSPAVLMQLTSGLWSFNTFAAAVELELFTRLAGGRSLTVDEVAAELGLQRRPADLLLVACASLGLLDTDGTTYRNSELSEAFLVVGRPDYFGGFVRYCDRREYDAWHRVVEGLRNNAPLTWDPAAKDSVFAAEDDPEMLNLFWEGMHSMSASTANALGKSYDFGSHDTMLDVGGGSGAYSIELCQQYPQLRATVFDLPHVCDIASMKITHAGMSDAVDTTAGDFRNDESLPGGYDLILLSSILHDWNEDTGRDLLKKCWEALPPNGEVVICELLLTSRRDGPPNAALMGMNMLVETEGGKNYSQDELITWLEDAGFSGARVVPLDAPGANGAVLATKT